METSVCGGEQTVCLVKKKALPNELKIILDASYSETITSDRPP